MDKLKKFTVPSSTNSPTKSIRTVKKVDLGAAANYGKDKAPTNDLIQGNLISSPMKTPQKSKNDILNELFDSQNDNSRSAIDNDDDFNPRENPNANFGDFSSAFGQKQSKTEGNDEFADFTSAFNSGVTIGTDNQWDKGFANYDNLLGQGGDFSGNPSNGDGLKGNTMIGDKTLRLTNESLSNSNNNSGELENNYSE